MKPESAMQAYSAVAHDDQAPSAPGIDRGPSRSAPEDGQSISDVSIDDWYCMLGAVAMRLRTAAGVAPAHLHNGAASSLHASALECADALDHLQATLRQALNGPWRATVKASADDRSGSAQP